MKNILVTGGTGYIGSHAVVELLQKGYTPIIVDDLSNSNIQILENIKTITQAKVEFYQVDLRNKQKLKEVFEKYYIEAVMHFAGAKAVGESCQKPFFYYENNILGSLNLFELMDEFGVKNIIFSSSATVYDANKKNPPFCEDDITGSTTNPYGTTKFLLENILRDLSIHMGFKVVNLRYFNPIGAHKSGLIGENPNGIPNNLLPFIMKVVSGELREVQVFGNDYETKDGTGERDYIHVIDLIDGHLKALEFIENKIPLSQPFLLVEKGVFDGFFEIFNLGTGKATTVMEMIHFTSEIIGKEVPYSIKPRRIGDLSSSFCNPEKAEKILGWKAKLSVKEGIEDSYNFVMKK